MSKNKESIEKSLFNIYEFIELLYSPKKHLIRVEKKKKKKIP